MEIIKIKKLKSGKYKLEFDNNDSIMLYDEVIINNNLLFNKVIDSSKLEQLYKENDYYDEYYKVLKYSIYKVRSIKQLKHYMNSKQIEEKRQNEIIKKLKDNNIVNDDNYLKSFISDKIYLTNDGPDKIKKELLEQDIDEELINKELNNYDQNVFLDKLEKQLIKKINNNQKYSNYSFKTKMIYYFINLGYNYEMINSLLDKNMKTNSKIIQKEYDKIYNKLSKKYSGDTLDYQIKNKLYQKGFSLDEINIIKK